MCWHLKISTLFKFYWIKLISFKTRFLVFVLRFVGDFGQLLLSSHHHLSVNEWNEASRVCTPSRKREWKSNWKRRVNRLSELSRGYKWVFNYMFWIKWILNVLYRADQQICYSNSCSVLQSLFAVRKRYFPVSYWMLLPCGDGITVEIGNKRHRIVADRRDAFRLWKRCHQIIGNRSVVVQ